MFKATKTRFCLQIFLSINNNEIVKSIKSFIVAFNVT